MKEVSQTELLPDEYKIDKPFSVHIFRGEKDKQYCKQLTSSLKSCSPKIDTIEYPMDNSNNIKRDLTKLSKISYDDKSCFILVMMGKCKMTSELGVVFADDEGDPINIESIWGKFVCVQSLRKKPKIFIIQATAPQTGLATDTMFIGDCKLSFPLEADLFITYKNLSHTDSGKFIKAISEKIKENGLRDDIISMITLLDNTYDRKVPRIISTLTKKFYFTSNPTREYSFEIMKKIENMEVTVEDTITNLNNVNLKKTRSVDSITRATSLQNMSPRSSTRRRNSTVTPLSPSYRPRADSKGKQPWYP